MQFISHINLNDFVTLGKDNESVADNPMYLIMLYIFTVLVGNSVCTKFFLCRLCCEIVMHVISLFFAVSQVLAR